MKRKIDIVADQNQRLATARLAIAQGKHPPCPADLVGPRSNYPSNEFYDVQIRAATELLANCPDLS